MNRGYRSGRSPEYQRSASRSSSLVEARPFSRLDRASTPASQASRIRSLSCLSRRALSRSRRIGGITLLLSASRWRTSTRSGMMGRVKTADSGRR